MIRNLFYSVWAVKHSDEWLKNVNHLLEYAYVFNGRKIVVIRSDKDSVKPAEVEAVFSEALPNVEFVHRRNNPRLGEVEGFIQDFGKLYSLRDDEITFYAHTKGVSYHAEGDSVKVQAVRTWRDAMYRGCLGELGRVQEALKTYACAGCFKDIIPGHRRWHYAGTFWWVNHKRLFELDWKSIPETYYGTEQYLGLLIPPESAYTIFQESPFHLYQETNLYDRFPQLCSHCWYSETSIATWPGDFTKHCPQCGGGMRGRTRELEATIPNRRRWDLASRKKLRDR